MCSIQSAKCADHAPQDNLTTTQLKLVTAQFLVPHQELLIQTTNATVQQIKKEMLKLGIKLLTLATAQQTFLCGMENIVLLVQLELNTIQKNNNVIIAQKDSSEIQ
jgi:hypothetical protein